MIFNVLCTPKFTPSESADIDLCANLLGISREALIRTAVKFFSRKCVPTHSRPEAPIVKSMKIVVIPR